MENEITVIIAEDDDGHATLIKKNLIRGGIINETIRFRDGEEVLNFLFKRGSAEHKKPGVAYLLLLDMRMPKVNGVEVLRQIKQNEELRKIPVIMITTTDDPYEVNKCHDLGCNSYIVKPVNYDKFVEVIQQLGIFIKIVQVPVISEENPDE
jgi:CheY-like chemotaxis protein